MAGRLWSPARLATTPTRSSGFTQRSALKQGERAVGAFGSRRMFLESNALPLGMDLLSVE